MRVIQPFAVDHGFGAAVFVEARVIKMCGEIQPDFIRDAVERKNRVVEINLVGMLPIKLCMVVKPVPSASRAKTVPIPKLPPPSVVPYKMLPDEFNPACGLAPSPGDPAK